MNIPNLISLGRLVSVPVIVVLILSDQVVFAFWLFIGSGLSDGVDGFIAKRFNSTTVLGAYLDPVADKVLLVAIYITLGQHGMLPIWLVITVVSRDILIVGAVLLSMALGQPLEMHPLWLSKINTAAQITLASLVLGVSAYDLSFAQIELGLIYLVGATTILSGAQYMVHWGRSAGAKEMKP